MGLVEQDLITIEPTRKYESLVQSNTKAVIQLMLFKLFLSELGLGLSK